MKSVVIIAIAAVAMLGVMVPDALGTKYVNNYPYEFFIDYPYGWQVDGTQDFSENGLIIYDKDDWTTMMNIHILEDINPQFSDDEEIDILNEVERDYCNNLTFNIDGMICYDFVLLSERNNSMVYEINGYRAITIFYEYTNVYSDSNFSGEYPRVGTTTHIYTENDVWQIFSVSEDDWVFDKHSDLILDTVASFRFENDTIPKEGTIVQQSSPVVQQPTAQNTCPQGTTTEIRGVDIVCVPKKTVEKTCPDGTYLGIDSNGNSACRSIQTNQIYDEQIKETVPIVTQKTQEPKNKPTPMFDDNYFPILIIIGVVVIVGVVIVFASKKKSKTVNPKTTVVEHNSQDTSSQTEDVEPENFSDALGKRKRTHHDNDAESTSPPPVDPKYATESTKGPIHSEPKKPQKKASPTRQQPSKRTVKPTFDSELDRILHATNPLDVLGLPAGTSFSVIKATYRELYKKYDPSKGIGNKSDVEKQRDQKVSTNLNHAYGQLKRQNRG